MLVRLEFASSLEEAKTIRAATKAKIAKVREGHDWHSYKPS